MDQDWAKQPPRTLEEALQFAEQVAEEACDNAFAVTGERPHPERRGCSVFIVWPDGAVTNEIQVEAMQ
jgi:hypothetical protein